MRLTALTAGLVAWLGAALASLCCLLPLTVIVFGLGSGAFMATTMQYRWLLVPAGIAGIVAGFALYIRERRRCDALACRMAGSRITLGLLIVASLVVTAAIVLDRFPEFTSDLLAHVMSSDAPHGENAMKRSTSLLAVLLLLITVNIGMAATSTVVLAVDGMTWGAWPVAVKKALEGLKGVNRADVSLKSKEAVVAFDPAQVTVQQMIAVVDRLGFRATLKQQR